MPNRGADPRVPVGSVTFQMVSRGFRPRVATLAAGVAASDSQISLVDASAFMNGDVLELASGERVEISTTPNTTTNIVTVRRGVEGTTPATGASNDVVRLIGNSQGGVSKAVKYGLFSCCDFPPFSGFSLKWSFFRLFSVILCHGENLLLLIFIEELIFAQGPVVAFIAAVRRWKIGCLRPLTKNSLNICFPDFSSVTN